MGIIHNPAAIGSLPVIASVLSRYDRDKLEVFVAVAIDLIDALDGDPDLEDGYDREAHNGDDQGDQAWPEWHTLRASQKRSPNALMANEDAEDDDPAGQYDEDCWTGPAMPDRGAGCPISDPGGGNVEDEGQINEIAPYAGPLAVSTPHQAAGASMEARS